MSEHFALEEFLMSATADAIGADNFPTWEVVENLKRLADTMEKIREVCGGVPVAINSGYRSPEVNDEVGGATNSAHLYGLACDFVVPSFGTPLEVCRAIEPYITVLQIDQLINEIEWVHLGLAGDGETARGECLTIDSRGTRSGF